MAIPRGSINHDIAFDFKNILSTLLNPKICRKANNQTLINLRKVLSKRFPNSYFSFLPFARTSFYATLKALDIQEGSEILMTPFNIAPMVNILDNLKIKPIFIDINLNDFGPDYKNLEKLLSRENVKCFFLTYLFGYVPDLDLILNLCKKYNVILIEDISQNIGAKYKNQALGTFGKVSFYSASLTKYVDTYNGSFTITKDKKLNLILEKFSNELIDPSIKRIRFTILKTFIWNIALNIYLFSFLTFPLLYLISKINKNFFNKLLGPNISLKRTSYLPDYYFEGISEIQVKLMINQFKKLDLLLNRRRADVNLALEAIKPYSDYFFNSYKIFKSHNETNFLTFWQFILKIKNTSIQKEVLFFNGVETGITNLPNLAAIYNVRLKNAALLKEQFIFLPIHNQLKSKNYKKIFDILIKEI